MRPLPEEETCTIHTESMRENSDRIMCSHVVPAQASDWSSSAHQSEASCALSGKCNLPIERLGNRDTEVDNGKRLCLPPHVKAEPQGLKQNTGLKEISET